MKKDVEKVLSNIRPALQADGGDIELVDVSEDGVVSVSLRGACSHCPMSELTLKNFVEKTLTKEVAGVKEVKQV